ncbi:hypothetical protein E1B28_007719 [Marasmius oreades]|uniref:Crinkler (CRN) family protein n=1 Tax=Marasmius oreades TaxID=181124 RepID=A0A9P7S2X6_9AGAR|nr:uncharacterized protein E1B28_007719 [Marasmius oreades]KAG7094102.1 hypothetical protein E1B28_007719 [Marasmius oreades]
MPLDDPANQESFIDKFQKLHELAWRKQDRSALFKDVAGSESEPGQKYESLKVLFQFTSRYQRRILVTSEYQVALCDANRWFAGQEPSKTKFTQADSYGGEDHSPVRCISPSEESEDEEEPEDEDESEDEDKEDSACGAFIVCGTPGIGKSHFLYYVLVERLLNRLPTCFQTASNKFSYWCERGVFHYAMKEFGLGFTMSNNVWFLMDSNERNVSPNAAILASGARVIQAASPWKVCLGWTEKQNTYNYMWFMKPSPLRELRRFWPDRKFAKILTKKEVTTFATAYGPSPRLITQYARQIDQYRSKLQSKIKRFTFDELKKLVFHIQDLNVDDKGISHWILGIYPGETRNQITVGFHTPQGLKLVKTACPGIWNSHVLDIYTFFNSVGQTRGTAVRLLEDILHQDLPTGGHWKATQLESNNQGPEIFTDSLIVYTTPPPEEPRTESYLLVGPDTYFVEAVPETSTRPQSLTLYRYTSKEAKSGQANVSWDISGYYLPLTPNQETFNSFIVNPQLRSVFALQFTVSEEHQVNEEGLQFLQKHYSDYNLYYILFNSQKDVKLVVPSGYDGKWVSLWHVYVTEDVLLSRSSS